MVQKTSTSAEAAGVITCNTSMTLLRRRPDPDAGFWKNGGSISFTRFANTGTHGK